MKTQVTSQDSTEETTLSPLETSTFTAIRNGHFVQLHWRDLDDSERRAIYVNRFFLYFHCNLTTNLDIS